MGAGIAGLVAARELRRAGYDVIVLEAANQVAGLATTTVDADGFSFDMGAHFITNRLAAEIGVSDSCRVVRYYGESVWIDQKHRRYPVGLMRDPAMASSALRAKVCRDDDEPRNAAEWFRRSYGDVLADRVALPLVEAWSGVPADDLSPAVGGKIPSSIAETIWLRVAARLTRRAVAIGYCNERPQSASVFHVYPKDGVSSLCRHLADELGPAVRTESPVEGIVVQDECAVAVRAAGELLEADLVVSTAPIHVLPRIVQGSEALAPFTQFRFRPMIAVNLKLSGRGLLNDVVVWTPRGTPFFRLTEATQSMPWLAPEGKTTVLCDIGAEVGDAHWAMSDDDLASLCIEHLEQLVPDASRRFLGVHVQRVPLAYPVFRLDYDDHRERLERQDLGVANLLSIGRNGAFAHVLMEDLYWRTRRVLRPWTAPAAADSQRAATRA